MKIELLDYPSKELITLLLQGLKQRAMEQGHDAHVQSFTLVLKDSEEQIMGGAVGNSFYGCLYTDTLWVHASQRGSGWGTLLMQQAEQIGRDRGCSFACVNTMNWEAREFYEKLGYAVEFTRQGFNNQSILYYLRKEL